PPPAPTQPATMYPINVAVVNSGPGVNWPTATASINCFSVSQCRRSTNSVCRNASKTYPLPNTTDPTFRNDKNSRPSPTGNAAPVAATAIAPATTFGSPTAFGNPTTPPPTSRFFIAKAAADTNPVSTSTSTGPTPKKLSPAASTAITASRAVRTPVRPSFPSAWITIATTAGLIADSTPSAFGSEPKRT